MTSGREIVVMGVSGCGKSTVGERLAVTLSCPFFNGDDLHPPENTAKMASGVPLAEANAGVALDIERPIDQLVALTAGGVTAARPKEV